RRQHRPRPPRPHPTHARPARPRYRAEPSELPVGTDIPVETRVPAYLAALPLSPVALHRITRLIHSYRRIIGFPLEGPRPRPASPARPRSHSATPPSEVACRL